MSHFTLRTCICYGLSVRRKSFCRNDCTNRADFWYTGNSPLTLHCGLREFEYFQI